MRKEQVRRREKPWAVFDEWIICNFAFSLNNLRNPSKEQQTILTAISRAATGIPPEPGDKFRVTGVSRGEFDHGVIIKQGMLPLEPLPKAAVPHGEL